MTYSPVALMTIPASDGPEQSLGRSGPITTQVIAASSSAYRDAATRISTALDSYSIVVSLGKNSVASAVVLFQRFRHESKTRQTRGDAEKQGSVVTRR